MGIYLRNSRENTKKEEMNKQKFERKSCCLCGYIEEYMYPIDFLEPVYCDECILSGDYLNDEERRKNRGIRCIV